MICHARVFTFLWRWSETNKQLVKLRTLCPAIQFGFRRLCPLCFIIFFFFKLLFLLCSISLWACPHYCLSLVPTPIFNWITNFVGNWTKKWRGRTGANHSSLHSVSNWNVYTKQKKKKCDVNLVCAPRLPANFIQPIDLLHFPCKNQFFKMNKSITIHYYQ